LAKSCSALFQRADTIENAPRRAHFSKGRQATGIPSTTRSRLQRLAGIASSEIERLSIALRSEDHDVTVKSILKEVNREKAEVIRSQRRKAFEAAPTLGDDAYDYRVGRAQDMLLDITSTPLIIADPPYQDEADPLFEWLADFAQRVLVPGGSLILFTGHHRLPRDFEIFKNKLRFWWPLVLRHDASRQVPGKYVVACHKPVLWFVKDHRRNNEYVLDVLSSTGRDKDEHHWGQGEAGITPIIEALSEPGETIIDPFCGSGRWGRIAVSKKRRWVGCDVVKGGSTEVTL
jgi:hypothetical protein